MTKDQKIIRAKAGVLELQILQRKVRHDLECSTPNSVERRDALAGLENITRVMAQRRFQPRPPSF